LFGTELEEMIKVQVIAQRSTPLVLDENLQPVSDWIIKADTTDLMWILPQWRENKNAH
jgi:hypothetical protein